MVNYNSTEFELQQYAAKVTNFINSPFTAQVHLSYLFTCLRMECSLLAFPSTLSVRFCSDAGRLLKFAVNKRPSKYLHEDMYFSPGVC